MKVKNKAKIWKSAESDHKKKLFFHKKLIFEGYVSANAIKLHICVVKERVKKPIEIMLCDRNYNTVTSVTTAAKLIMAYAVREYIESK